MDLRNEFRLIRSADHTFTFAFLSALLFGALVGTSIPHSSNAVLSHGEALWCGPTVAVGPSKPAKTDTAGREG
jgi:hypothetical protein